METLAKFPAHHPSSIHHKNAVNFNAPKGRESSCLQWKDSFLSAAGRDILLNSTLTLQLSFFCSAQRFLKSTFHISITETTWSLCPSLSWPMEVQNVTLSPADTEHKASINPKTFSFFYQHDNNNNAFLYFLQSRGGCISLLASSFRNSPIVVSAVEQKKPDKICDNDMELHFSAARTDLIFVAASASTSCQFPPNVSNVSVGTAGVRYIKSTAAFWDFFWNCVHVIGQNYISFFLALALSLKPIKLKTAWNSLKRPGGRAWS